ncbi:MAG: LPS export ABC transporter periplasmic protein LptC [Parvularculales bacterium]
MNTSAPRKYSDTGYKPRSSFSERTRTTTALKIILPLLTVLLAVVIFLYSDLEPPSSPDIQYNLEGLEQREGAIHVLHPSSRGVDSEGRPYVIEAESAARATDDSDSIIFHNLEASLGDKTSENTADMALEAGKGLFDTENNHLELSSPVVARSAQGYKMETDAVFVDLAAGVLESSGVVSATGPLGTLSANTMTVRDRGAILSFRDNIRVTIIPNTSKQIFDKEEQRQ